MAFSAVIAAAGRRGTSLAFVLLGLALNACSGIDVTADPTAPFEATQYSRYAWRSAPPSRPVASKDKLPQKSPAIRASFEARMNELGYRLVDRENAQFLVEYMAATGFNDGQLARVSSNTVLYPSSVNRQIDGASADNAYALGGVVETGNMMLVFVDAESMQPLWRVEMTMVVHDTNRVDEADVQRAVRRGLATLPPAPEGS